MASRTWLCDRPLQVLLKHRGANACRPWGAPGPTSAQAPLSQAVALRRTYGPRTRRNQKLIKGKRYPITYSGLKSAWKRLRAVAGVSDFRFHDFRHDFATKLLRETRNLKLVQKALNHADIKTTTKYAHVVDDDLVAGLDAMQKSRRKSRKPDRKV